MSLTVFLGQNIWFKKQEREKATRLRETRHSTGIFRNSPEEQSL